MNEIKETLTTKITSACDVLVAGGGFAGISAALAAARGGANVVLLEREFMLGGLGTAGLITVYLSLCDGMGNQVMFGQAEELLKISISKWEDKNNTAYWEEGFYPKAWLEGGTKEEKTQKRYEVKYNPHICAIHCEKLLLEHGVKILYGTTAVAVSKNDDKINAVIIENKSGRSAIYVNMSVVDCTGDADICKFAGAKTQNFKQGNITAGWYYSHQDGDVNLHQLGVSDRPEKYKDETYVDNFGRRYSGIDGEELSEFVINSHKMTYEKIVNNRGKNSTHAPITIPVIPQVRMTRRLVGAYAMDDEEILCEYNDTVGRFGDWRKRGPVYNLPFSTLYGKEVKNLIVAGRCISVTDAMWDITRVIPVCSLSGEVAGTAACMCDDFKNIDIVALQDRLRANGNVF